MGSNSTSAVLSLFVLLQIGGALAFALGGLYVLYCFNRAAAGIDRMADVAEAWLLMQQHQMQQQAQQAAQNQQNMTPSATFEKPVADSLL